MTKSKRDLRLGAFCVGLGAFVFGLSGSAMAWVEPPKDYPDVRIYERVDWERAAVAFDPSDPSRLVAGIVAGNACLVTRSTNGGRTWGAALPLPLSPEVTCAGPLAVTYAADGSGLYAAYAFYDEEAHWGLGFSISADHGATWSMPTTTSLPEVIIGCSYLDLAAAPDGPSVYLAATCTDTIYFGSSHNEGLSWNSLTVIAGGPLSDRGSLAVGRNGIVLIAYGQSYLTGCGKRARF